MLKFILPTEADREAVTAFYAEIERDGGECIGFANHDARNKNCRRKGL